jgi:hypothetical protein
MKHAREKKNSKKSKNHQFTSEAHSCPRKTNGALWWLVICQSEGKIFGISFPFLASKPYQKLAGWDARHKKKDQERWCISDTRSFNIEKTFWSKVKVSGEWMSNIHDHGPKLNSHPTHKCSSQRNRQWGIGNKLDIMKWQEAETWTYEKHDKEKIITASTPTGLARGPPEKEVGRRSSQPRTLRRIHASRRCRRLP